TTGSLSTSSIAAPVTSAELPRHDGPNPSPNRSPNPNPDPNRAAPCRGAAVRSPADLFLLLGSTPPEGGIPLVPLSFGASTDTPLTTLSCLLLTWWWNFSVPWFSCRLCSISYGASAQNLFVGVLTGC
ncbi:unnamed protein product, partial [Musa acuminata subsp. burmannicoides]